MNTSIKGKTLRFDDPYLVVELEDGRGTSLEWPELDVQLSIESMLHGVPIRVLHAVGS